MPAAWANPTAMDKKPPMLKRAVESGWALLDWCWPLPLGVFFGVLVLAASGGTWLAFREPSTPRRPPARTDSPVATESPARGEAPQPPSESAPPAPAEPSAPAQRPPVGSTSGETPSGSRLSPAQDAKLRDTLIRGRWYMQHQQYRPALEEFQAVLEMDPANREAQAAIQQAREARANPEPPPGPLVGSGSNSSAPRGAGQTPRAPREKPTAASASRVPAAGSRLSPAQEAKLRDTLIRGRWYMQHQQYGPALEEFQAALEMDPTNREAQTAIQQAREPSANPQPPPQP